MIMKVFLTLLGIIFSLQAWGKEATPPILEKIYWLGHSSIRIEGQKVIYVDPWNVPREKPADLILITHPHYDHCSPNDVEKIRKEETLIVATIDCAKKLGGQARVIQPGEEIIEKGIKIKAVPAYNITKPFHPKNDGWVGFVVEIEGQTIYHAGDTDFIPEMKEIHPDIAFLPIGGTYTMDVLGAVEACKWIKPKLAIPIHWGTITGKYDDALNFKKLSSSPVKILRKK